MDNQDKINKPNIEGAQDQQEKDKTMPPQGSEQMPKRAEIKPTNKTIMDFQDNTNLKEDEDQISDQGGSMGSVPPGYRDDQDYYA